ncbi:MAG: hypothetical protein A2169_08780 [Deltaproteobacteria bacterium RBG_13_47_9]|nr:MAG: hypothetical protein A2169_08780 [Deltaproteobacteria bacterium RBG_13_47_9]
MEAYELYSFDRENGIEFMGILPERRKNPIRITRESVMNWGRMLLSDHTVSKTIFFKKVTLKENTGRFLRLTPS